MEAREISQLLKSHALFGELPDDQLKKLVAITKEVKIPANTIIVHEDALADNIFIISEGDVEVLKKDDEGKQHKLSQLSSPEMFGEFALLEGTIRSATVQTLTETTLLVISAAEFKSLIADSKSLAPVFQNLSGKLSERLRGTNELTARALERELRQEKVRVAMGRFLIFMIFMLCLYSFAMSFVTRLMAETSAATLITLPMLLILIISAGINVRSLGYPMRFYGLTWIGWKNSLYESLLVTLPILLLIVLIKWLLIKFVPIYSHAQLFNPYSPIKRFHFTSISISTFWWLMVIFYCLHSPVQELLARGFLQSPLQEFLTSKYRVTWAIVISNLVFATFHLTNSLVLAVSAFVPGLIWGWLYSRHKTLVGVSVSHILVGVWAGFIVGFSPH